MIMMSFIKYFFQFSKVGFKNEESCRWKKVFCKQWRIMRRCHSMFTF